MVRQKVKTTPDQREVLWLLAESDRMSCLLILNTLHSKFGVSPDTFLGRIERALAVLKHLGCVYFLWQFESEIRPVLANERPELSLKDLFVWDENAKAWVAQPQSNVVDLIVQLTRGGVEILDLIPQEPTP